MGACFSTWIIVDSNHHLNLSSTSSANLITLNGQLRQFPIPLTVSQLLLQIDSESESESKSKSEYFICNSDALYYDEHIQAMELTEELQSGQIYFTLPNSKLHYPLSASDMAALAVKASAAISSINSNRKSSKSQITPIDLSIQSPISEAAVNFKNKNYSNDKQAGGGLGISRCGSMRKIQRYSTKRAKLAARSFRRLTTIHEASDLQAY
ncbi:Poly polymerase [Heracleum sosnowskyi]|uniref:Poly polymerase n=1 Tax=Heracleum sosnowskyi TaxID=360622 RepID=A0AAD8IWL4_9APIA|nr:Poly polymerase [Heracleum sosnowskyi]